MSYPPSEGYPGGPDPYGPPPGQPGQPGQPGPYGGQPGGPYGGQYGGGWPSYGPGPVQPGQPGQPGPPRGTPGPVVAARVIMWVQGGLWAIVTLLAVIGRLASIDDGQDSLAGEDAAYRSGYAIGALLTILLLIGFTVAAMVLAARFAPGRSGVRVGSLVYEGILCFLGLLSLVGAIVALANEPAGGAVALVFALLALGAAGAAFGCLIGGAAREYFARRW